MVLCPGFAIRHKFAAETGGADLLVVSKVNPVHCWIMVVLIAEADTIACMGSPCQYAEMSIQL